jgi:hypothetical protein
MDADSAARFRATHRDDRGGAVHVRPVDGPGFPCRACLRLGQPGETMLLASWDLPLPQGPYWTPSPVFLHAHDCGGAPVEDALPETVVSSVTARVFSSLRPVMTALSSIKPYHDCGALFVTSLLVM